jgi:hypothetical protein
MIDSGLPFSTIIHRRESAVRGMVLNPMGSKELPRTVGGIEVVLTWIVQALEELVGTDEPASLHLCQRSPRAWLLRPSWKKV